MPLRPASLPLDPERRQKTAKDLFNFTWTLLEKADRSPQESELMIDAAHGSRLFWAEFGTPVHNARSEWQLSRVYSVVGRAEPARHHAEQCLEICKANGISDFDLAYAYEALARAARVQGDLEACHRHCQSARDAAADIAKAQDRDLVLSDLAELA